MLSRERTAEDSSVTLSVILANAAQAAVINFYEMLRFELKDAVGMQWKEEIEVITLFSRVQGYKQYRTHSYMHISNTCNSVNRFIAKMHAFVT